LDIHFTSELPTKELHHLPRKITPQTYQTFEYVVPRGGIFFGNSAALSQEVTTVK
jgi:hypothetical protein